MFRKINFKNPLSFSQETNVLHEHELPQSKQHRLNHIGSCGEQLWLFQQTWHRQRRLTVLHCTSTMVSYKDSVT